MAAAPRAALPAGRVRLRQQHQDPAAARAAGAIRPPTSPSTSRASTCCARRARSRPRHPRLRVLPVCADFTRPFDAAAGARRAAPRGLLPGLDDRELRAGRGAQVPGAGGASSAAPAALLLIGVDLRKSRAILEPAYDDAAGRDRGVQPQPAAAHQPRARRELRPRRPSTTARSGTPRKGASRCTSSAAASRRCGSAGAASPSPAARASTPRTPTSTSSAGFAALARSAGFEVLRVWTDDARLFSVQLLRTAWT